MSDDVSEGTLEEFGIEMEKPFERIGSNYYSIHNDCKTNWIGAVEKCRQVNGHLINLQNEQEILAIASRLNKSLVYWTDLNNLVETKYFDSLTTGSKSDFYNPSIIENHNQCGYLQFSESEQKFELSTQHCFDTKACPICQSIKPLKLTFIFW